MDRVRDRADLGDLGAELASRAAVRSALVDGHRTQRPRAGAQLSRMARTRLPQACLRSVLAVLTGVLCLVVASPAVAHQPHVVGDAARVAVSDPEISKAYYGRLPGVPARYEISSRRPFTLYAQITVPDISGARRDYRLTILGPDGQLLAQLSTPTSHWKRFFEPFGGDHYLSGPEYRRHVPAGHYIVQVSRAGNRGTYVLAIGEAEQWGPIEALSALMVLPTIKHDYFHESVLQAWLSRTVPAIAILVALILLAGWLLNRLIRRLVRRRRATAN